MKKEREVKMEDSVNMIKVKLGIKDKGLKESEDEIEVIDKFSLNMLCPISYSTKKVPVRGENCTHVETFDLQNYLSTNLKCPKFKCPICRKPTFEPLLDKFQAELLSKLPPEATRIFFHKSMMIFTDDSCTIPFATFNSTDSSSLLSFIPNAAPPPPENLPDPVSHPPQPSQLSPSSLLLNSTDPPPADIECLNPEQNLVPILYCLQKKREAKAARKSHQVDLANTGGGQVQAVIDLDGKAEEAEQVVLD